MAKSSSQSQRRGPSSAIISSHLLVGILLVLLLLVTSFVPATKARRSRHNGNKQGQALAFQTEPVSQYVSFDGKRATLKCQSSTPGAEVSWLFNKQPLNINIFEGVLRQVRNKLQVRLPKPASNSTSNELSPEMRRVKSELEQGHGFQCVIRHNNQALVSQPAKLLVAGIEAFEPSNNQTVTVTEDNIAVISCSPPKSVPIAVTEFLFNGSLIDRSKGRYYLMPSGDLQIFKVRQSDAGLYQCVAHNPFLKEKRNASHFVSLKVRRQPSSGRGHNSPRQPRGQLVWAVTPKPTTAPVMGTNLTIECVANGPHPPNVTWARNNGPLPKWRSVQVGGNLVIISVRPEDDGVYVCTATAGETGQITARTGLSVQEPPQFIKTPPQEVTLHDGKEISLECPVKGNPLPTVTWKFNGRSIEDVRERIEIDVLGQSGEKLTIRNPRRDMHEGLYQCFAENFLGTTYYYTRVVRPPAVGTVGDADDYDNDDYAFREMDARGHGPPPEDEDDGGPDRPQPRGEGFNCDLQQKDWTPVEKTLCHPPKTPKDTIYNKPTKPLVMRLSQDSVMVRWSIQEVGGTLPIQFFKVQWKEISPPGEWQTADDDIVPHIRAYAVGGLKSNVPYKFRVAAVYSNNDNQGSANSDVFEFSKIGPGQKPSAVPTILQILGISPSALWLKWDYSQSELHNTRGFYIWYRSVSSAGSFSKETILTPIQREHHLTHLLPDTAYELKMQSFNEYGTSDFTTLYSNKTFKQEHKVPAVTPDITNNNTDFEDVYGFGDDRTLYTVLAVAVIALILVVIVCITLCIIRHRQSKQTNNVVKRRTPKPRERNAKAQSVHNLNHANYVHDYGNPYGNYHKGAVNGMSNGTLGLKSSLSNGFVFKDSTSEDKHENINIRLNQHNLDSEPAFEGRSRTLSSTTFLGSRSVSTRDIMRRTSSASQHSLHNNHVAANNATNILSSNSNQQHQHQNNNVPNNNLNDPPESVVINGFVLNTTMERGRRGRASAHFNHDEQHPNAFAIQVKMNHRSSSFTRLNGTLERRRKSRTDLLAAVDSGTLSRGECEPMLLSRCHGTLASNGSSQTNGHVIMQSSC